MAACAKSSSTSTSLVMARLLSPLRWSELRLMNTKARLAEPSNGGHARVRRTRSSAVRAGVSSSPGLPSVWIQSTVMSSSTRRGASGLWRLVFIPMPSNGAPSTGVLVLIRPSSLRLWYVE